MTKYNSSCGQGETKLNANYFGQEGGVMGGMGTRIVEKFRKAEIFAIFCDQTPAHENFLLRTSRAQRPRVADPVNRQKADLFCCRSIEQTAENFHNLRSTRRNCE